MDMSAVCPRCKNTFLPMRGQGNLVSRLPLILPCSHIICENCVVRCVQTCHSTTSTISCSVCNKTTTVSPVKDVTLVFPPHFSLIGKMLWQTSRSGGTQQHSENATQLKSSVDTSSSKLQILDECRRNTKGLFFDVCPIHAMQANVTCTQCNEGADILMCAYCFFDNHEGHLAKHFYKMNDEENKSVEVLKLKAKMVLKNLLESKERINNLNKLNTVSAIQQSAKQFINLHAKLQQAENKLMTKLNILSEKWPEAEKFENEINTKIKYIQIVLCASDSIDSKTVNTKRLIQELTSIIDIECVLSKGTNANELIVDIEDKLSDFDEKIDIKFPGGFTLSKLQQFTSEEFDVAELQQLYERCSSPLISDQCVNTTLTMTINDTDMQSVDDSLPESSSSSNLVESQTQFTKVVVTHVNSLDDFYIQTKDQLSILGKISLVIKRHLSKMKRVQFVTPGELYVAHYSKKGVREWRRARLESINSNRYNFEVFFLDYGNVSYVGIEHLRQMNERGNLLRRSAPCATHCTLHNPEQVVWNSNARLHFAKTVMSQELYSKIIRSEFSVKHHEHMNVIELFILNATGHYQSIYNLLVQTVGVALSSTSICGLSSASSTESYKCVSPPCETMATFTPELKFFPSSKTFGKHSKVFLIVTYVVDPFEIYIVLDENRELLDQLCSNLRKHYEYRKELICVPVINTDVVVYYQHKLLGNWHRASVISVNKTAKSCDVFLVDSGSTVTVKWTDVRILSEKFTKLEKLAIPVKLAAVLPTDNNEIWSHETVEFLRTHVTSKDRENIKVMKILICKSFPLEVALFAVGNTRDECINALLANNELAISTGKVSQNEVWPHDEDIEELSESTFQVEMIKKAIDVAKDCKADLYELRNGISKRVDVLRCDSPDMIYFIFCDQNSEIQKFDSELQAYYRNKECCICRSGEWRLNEFGVVYDRHKNQFQRAIVQDISKAAGGFRYTVWLCDAVRERVVSHTQLFEYHDFFKSQSFFYVYRCKLSEIIPAGGSNRWSHMANEILRTLFDTYKSIHMRKVSDESIRDKIMVVKMWYSTLMPTEEKEEPSDWIYVSVKRTLTECGVALSTVNDIEVPEPPTIIIEPDSSTKSDQSHVSCSDSTESWADECCVTEHVIQDMERFQFPDPYPLNEKFFLAKIICVKSSGEFYIMQSKLHTAYNTVEAAMKERFDKRTPSIGHKWTEGVLCTVKFKDLYYRGRINRILSPDRIQVLMVDFGDLYEVDENSLYQEIMFLKVPIFITKVFLFDVVATDGSGIWIEADNDLFMRKAPVKDVFISIIQELDNKIEVEIYIDRNKQKSFNSYLASLSSTLTREVQLEETIEIVDEPDFNHAYKSIEFVNDSPLFVKSVISHDTVVLSLDEELVVPVHLTLTDGENAPKLENVVVGIPCIVFCEQFGAYCRASVYRFEQNSNNVCLFLVDYGVTDNVPKDQLRAVRKEWMLPPVRNYIVELCFTLNQPSMQSCVILNLSKLIGQIVNVKVISRMPSLRVHLYSDGKLCYHNLIENDIIRDSEIVLLI